MGVKQGIWDVGTWDNAIWDVTNPAEGTITLDQTHRFRKQKGKLIDYEEYLLLRDIFEWLKFKGELDKWEESAQ